MIFKFLLLIFIFIPQAFALDAVVTVLETPMLKSEDLDAPVVQYLRKGDTIKIDPSLNNNTDYDHLGPVDFNVKTESPFIKTLDRQGNVVYVIREHLYIYYTNQKELGQTTLRKDPTDYRLEEPLPKRYPLIAPSGYRAQVLVGMSQPYFENYPYSSKINKKEYGTPVDAQFTFLKQVAEDTDDRFFFGGSFNFRTFKNSYVLDGGSRSDEQGLKMGIGPTISYDAYKGMKNRLNLNGGVIVNLFNQLNVAERDGAYKYERTYKTVNLTPRLGVQYHRKEILESLDFIIGTAIEVEPATTYKSKEDKFKTPTTSTLSAFLGVQSVY